MKHLVSLIIGLHLTVPSFSQRTIPEKTIKSIEERMVDLKSSIFLVDSLYQDYIKNGKFTIQEYANPQLTSSGSSLLYGYYKKLTDKYGKECLECTLRANSLNQQIIEEKNLEQELVYRNLLKVADNYFNEKYFSKAIELYEQAIVFRPSDPYPKDRIIEVKAILAQTKYQDYITAADNYFASKDYVNAKLNYMNALAIKPMEGYPKDKIVEIDVIIYQEK